MKRTLMIAAVVSMASLATAQKGGPSTTLSTATGPAGAANTTPTLLNSTFDATAGTTASFDMTGSESWDGLGAAANMILAPGIPDGASVTGLGWTGVTVATVGGSWLSEAVMNFDGAVFLTVGAGDDFAGTASYSSGGIIVLADVAIPDIPVVGDLAIELFEGFDDVSGAIDANYTGGSIEIVYSGGAAGVPTVSQWGLIILTVLLLLGVVAMSVKSKEQTVNA